MQVYGFGGPALEVGAAEGVDVLAVLAEAVGMSVFVYGRSEIWLGDIRNAFVG